MAPRKNKNKMIYEGESSAAAANKRRRIEFLNPIAEIPSIPFFQQHHNPPQNTTVIGTGLHLSPPSPIPHRQEEELAAAAAGDDDFLSPLIGQQNFIMNYHMNQMLLSVNDFWRNNLAEEVKKRKEMEASLKHKEELLDRLRQMYHYYEERTCFLEDIIQRKIDGVDEFSDGPMEEEVQSRFLDLNEQVANIEMVCKNCKSRPATMLWLPCRHLCVCLVCERRVKICPICGEKKTGSFMINISPP